jgi:RHS repeat-associated protein
VLETVEYEPFGRVLSRSRADAGPLPAQAEPLCPFGFSSRYLDPESGLLYFGYRYYTPDLGRWLCRDPLQEQAGPNLYAYCQNDPINQIDPLGLWAEGGHYYTVLYVAQAAGWEFGEALQLAAYSQAPDEIGKYEAVKSLHDSTQAQERLHCLNGADAVPLRGRLEAVLAPDTGLDVAETGVLLHVLGDAYSHSREVSYPTGYRTESITLAGETFEEQTPIWGRKEVCFPRLVGHAATVVTKGCSGSEPDAIGRHPELYKQYVEDLYSLLCALRPNAPREQNGFAIGNLLDLAKGEMSRSPITSMGGYGYDFQGEVRVLRTLFDRAVRTDSEKEQFRRMWPEEHDVTDRKTTWDALPSAAGAIIERVMELGY